MEMSDEELNQCKLTFDPNADKWAAPMDKLTPEVPVEDMNTDQLFKYTTEQLWVGDGLAKEIVALGRKKAVHVFRAGHALTLLKNKIGRGFEKVFLAQGFAKTTYSEAILLYEKAGTEDAIVELSITAAKNLYGITKPKKKREKSGRAKPVFRVTHGDELVTDNDEEQPDEVQEELDETGEEIDEQVEDQSEVDLEAQFIQALQNAAEQLEFAGDNQPAISEERAAEVEQLLARIDAVMAEIRAAVEEATELS